MNTSMSELAGTVRADDRPEEGISRRARSWVRTAAVPSAPVEISARSVAGLRSMREALARCLNGVDWLRVEIGDAQLVLAELATNAFTHDRAPEFSALVTCSPRQLEMTTFHAGRVQPPSAPVASTAPTGEVVAGGRGLAIVDRLVVERLVSSRAGTTSTYVRMAR